MVGTEVSASPAANTDGPVTDPALAAPPVAGAKDWKKVFALPAEGRGSTPLTPVTKGSDIARPVPARREDKPPAPVKKVWDAVKQATAQRNKISPRTEEKPSAPVRKPVEIATKDPPSEVKVSTPKEEPPVPVKKPVIIEEQEPKVPQVAAGPTVEDPLLDTVSGVSKGIKKEGSRKKVGDSKGVGEENGASDSAKAAPPKAEKSDPKIDKSEPPKIENDPPKVDKTDPPKVDNITPRANENDDDDDDDDDDDNDDDDF